MTTPTIEQVVQWAKEAEKLSKAACKEISGMEYRAAEAVALITLARADIEAKVAAQQEVLGKIALIAHSGGLINMTQDDALIAIRKLTLPYFDLSKSNSESIKALSAGKEVK